MATSILFVILGIFILFGSSDAGDEWLDKYCTKPPTDAKVNELNNCIKLLSEKAYPVDRKCMAELKMEYKSFRDFIKMYCDKDLFKKNEDCRQKALSEMKTESTTEMSAKDTESIQKFDDCINKIKKD